LKQKLISQEQDYGLKSKVRMCAWGSVHICNSVVYPVHANSYLFQTSCLVVK